MNSSLKNKTLHFRVTEDEKKALLDRVNTINSQLPKESQTNTNQYLQVIVRHNIGLGSDFLRHELEVLKETNRVLLGIGRNLNQVVKKINSGDFVVDVLTEQFLKQIAAYVVKSRNQITAVIDHNQKRSIKGDSDE